MFKRFAESLIKSNAGILPKAFERYQEIASFDPLSLSNQPAPAYGDQASINKSYESIVWVYRCVGLIANNIAMLNKKIVSVNGDEKIDISTRPEFLPLVKPNAWQTEFDFWYESISRLQLQGELFWELQFADNSDKIIAIYADWASEKIKIIPDPESFISHYIRQIGGKSISVPEENVFYIKYFNPHDTLRGMAPLRAAVDSMTIDLNTTAFQKKFFEEGMRLPGYFSTKEVIGEAEAKRMMKSLNKEWGGLDKMHNAPVLWGGVEFHPVTSTAFKVEELVALRSMTREEICISQGVPLEAIGLGAKKYENLEQAQRMLWTGTLLPIIRKVQDLVNLRFLPRLTKNPAVRFEFDLSDVDVLREDRSQIVEALDKAANHGAVSRNELRTALNLEPSEAPGMNEPIFATAPEVTIPAKSLQKKETKETPEEATPEGRAAIWRRKIAQIERSEDSFRSTVQKFLDAQAEAIIARLPEFVKAPIGKVGAIPETLVGGQVFDFEYWVAEIRKIGDPAILSAFLDGVNEVINLNQLDLIHPAIRSALANRQETFAIRVNEFTRSQVETVLQEGLSQRFSLEALSQEMNERVFGANNIVRARRIARTEVVGAANWGIGEGIRINGQTRKMWLTSRDDNVRDTHRPMDGIVRNYEELFLLSDGKEMPFPQEINERCIIVPTLLPRSE